MNHEATIRRAERAHTRRDEKWKSKWDEAFAYTFPSRDLSRNDSSTPHWADIYDSEPADAASRLVNTILTGLTPPWFPWFKLAPGIETKGVLKGDQDAIQGASRALDVATEVILAHMHASNFYRVMQETISDMVVACGIIAVDPDEDNGTVVFMNVPLDEVALEQDEYGRIQYIYHKQEVPNHVVLRRYSEKLEPSTQKALAESPFENSEIMTSCEYDYEEGKHIVRKIFWRGADVSNGLTEAVSDQKKVVHEAKLDYRPYHIARWSAMPKNPYGEGPGLKETADMRTLNNIMQRFLQMLVLNATGVWTAIDDDVINPYTLSLQGGDIIPVSSNDNQNPPIRRLDVPTQVQAVGLGIEDIRDRIKRAMFADRFTPSGKTPLTATEILERSDLIAREMGAAFGLLTGEFLIPLIGSVVNILQQYAKDDDVKGIMKTIDVNGLGTNVDFMGNIARAQRNREGAELINAAATLAQMGEAYPDVTQVLKHREMITEAMRLQSIPSKYIRTPSEQQEEINKGMQGAQQAQAQLAPPQPPQPGEPGV
jgi:hypothetical protein